MFNHKYKHTLINALPQNTIIMTVTSFFILKEQEYMWLMD